MNFTATSNHSDTHGEKESTILSRSLWVHKMKKSPEMSHQLSTEKEIINMDFQTINASDSDDATQAIPSLNGMDISTLSPRGQEAMDGFVMFLTMLQKSHLDREGFDMLLNTMKYNKPRDGLYDALLEDIILARLELGCTDEEKACDSSDQSNDIITVEDMFYLYSSAPYKLLDVEDVGENLMKTVDTIFNAVDQDKDNLLDRNEFNNLISMLVGGSSSTEERDGLFDSIDKDGVGTIARRQVKQAILKLPNKISEGIPSTFNSTLLDPAHATNEQFVSGLEKYCLEHEAVNHHLLENIAGGCFGNKKTADILLRFFTAYQLQNKHFNASVEAVVPKLTEREHRKILRENIREEMGVYDDETLEMAKDLFGVEAEEIEYVPHKELYSRFLSTLEKSLKVSYKGFVPGDLVKHYDEASAQLKNDLRGQLSMIYFGSELIVPRLYGRLLQGLKVSTDLTDRELIFFYLHIDMDAHHADCMRKIILDHADSREDRLKFVVATEMMLQARVSFYNSLVKKMNFLDRKNDNATLYNKQSDNWKREKPKCLSDFTGRPLVFDYCRDALSKGATVLDVGCGEGYVSRTLAKMGARKIVGVDVSPGMIERANAQKEDGQYFVVGDASRLKESLRENFCEANMMDGDQFDLAVAVFLFNYMSITDMNCTIQDVFSLLKPGGEFVMSVPHPFMKNKQSSVFGFGNGKTDAYFSQRDSVLDGHICTIDGKSLNVRMHFKTFDDYISALRTIGFEIIDIKEARVKPEHVSNPDISEFMKNVNDVPLHLVFKVRKPEANATENISRNMGLMPKIVWNDMVKSNFDAIFTARLPSAANRALVETTLKCYHNGIRLDDIVMGKNVDTIPALKNFCSYVRKRLLHETGGMIVKGLDMDALGGKDDDLEKLTECSRIAYYLLSAHIGFVDGSARGKLFDVKNSRLNALDKSNDNVLFSVSDSDCSWHTDGASKTRFYDVVGLMCVSPAKEGGAFRIANACNAHDAAKLALPKFLMYELKRPVPRDVLENGKGQGSEGLGMSLSRSSGLLPMRIRNNSYPIYAGSGTDRMRFRYMRHWIETGHAKTNWRVPTLLRIAMDVLDDKLDQEKCFDDKLDRGDIIFTNNAVVAHARDSFEDFAEGEGPPRHMLRVWLQVRKFDMNESSSSTTSTSTSQ